MNVHSGAHSGKVPTPPFSAGWGERGSCRNDTEGVTRESRLVEDLDLDSIDAVDMIVHLQNMIGKRIKPEAFKSVRTVGDVVDVIYDFSQQNGEAAN